MMDSALRLYRRRPGREVTAVQLRLDTEGFTYTAWGGPQRCKPGDWIVDNGEDVYTVDAGTFGATYRAVGLGRYEKHTEVWAKRASDSGRIVTKEGSTDYDMGDYLVYNDRAKVDGWSMSAEKFNSLYEPIDPELAADEQETRRRE